MTKKRINSDGQGIRKGWARTADRVSRERKRVGDSNFLLRSGDDRAAGRAATQARTRHFKRGRQQGWGTKVLGAAADPKGTVAHDLDDHGVPRRGAGLGGPDPQTGLDPLDDIGFLDERNDPHGSCTPELYERNRLADFLNQACPRTLRGHGGGLVGFLDGRSFRSLGFMGVFASGAAIEVSV
jgi:hypothetical protein